MKCCINIISSRYLCLHHCLDSLWENFNKNKNHKVFVYYFDDIYDNPKYHEFVKQKGQDVEFRSIPYKTPSFLKESELFYNRSDIQYAKAFGVRRKGYLHMCNFTSNMYGYKNTSLEEYDMIMTHDDESGYDMPMINDPFCIMNNKKEYFGAFKVGQRLKNGHPHQGHLDTRIGLWEFTKDFIEKNNVDPKNKKLKKLLTDDNAAWSFHFLDWCDTYVIKTEMFKLSLWKKWIDAVNESGGIYKYRWGDNEIISLFVHMIQEEIVNLNYVDTGFHNQGKFRNIQDIAPSIKDVSK